jgi:putative ABC transport system permease protein
MGVFLNDLKFALRGLRKNPTFTIAAITTLALGIGASGAIFTALKAVLLQPLPYPDANRIVSIGRSGGGGVPEPGFAFWEQNNPGLNDLTACTGQIAINLNTRTQAEVVSAMAISRSYFGLFGPQRKFLARRKPPSQAASRMKQWQPLSLCVNYE